MSEFICIKHDSDARDECVKEMQTLESQLALAREGLEKIYWALEDQCCEEQPTACSLRDIAKEALAKLSETK